ncbi:MAG: transporter [Bacteroidaceae bacterium]|nr:transporter [Bacteroidaceae bacterium]
MLLLFLKNWTLPTAISVGVVSYLLFAFVPELDAAGDVLCPIFETLLPLTIFLTLFVTFSKVDFHLMRVHRWHGAVLLAQFLFVALLLMVIQYAPFDIGTHVNIFELSGISVSSRSFRYCLEAVLICVIAPCASASPVVTAKLGGNLTQMTTFVLLSSFVASLFIPAVFPMLEPHPGITFLSAFLVILRKLALVLLLPLFLGAIVRHQVKPLYRWFVQTPDIGFYLWSVSLAITSGITMKNIVHSEATLWLLGGIAVLTLLTSFIQFKTGRLIGRIFGEQICTGQAMFQKNTGLAIWIAYVYLTPMASIGAGCYVLWQNIINSYELWQHRQSVVPEPGKAIMPTASRKSTRP